MLEEWGWWWGWMQVWFSLGSHSKNASSSSWKHWLCWVPWWLRGRSVCSMYRGCVLTAARVQIQTVASCSTSPPLTHPCFLSHTHTHMHKRKIHLPHPLISWPAAFIGAPDCCVPPHSLWLDSSGADWESAYINANTEKYTSGWSDHWRQCYFLLVLEKREEGGKRLQAKREGEGELTLSDTIRSSVTLLQPCLITCFTHWPRF